MRFGPPHVHIRMLEIETAEAHCFQVEFDKYSY